MVLSNRHGERQLVCVCGGEVSQKGSHVTLDVTDHLEKGTLAWSADKICCGFVNQNELRTSRRECTIVAHRPLGDSCENSSGGFSQSQARQNKELDDQYP